VTYPDGAVTTIGRSVDSAVQQTVISYDEAGAEDIHRRKQARLTQSSFVMPDTTVIPQTSGMIRSIRNGAGECSYFNQEDPTTNQVILVYEGGNKLYRLTTSGFDHMRTTEVATGWTFGQPLTGLSFALLETYQTNNQAMITRRTDVLGRATTYTVDAPTATVRKITHPDGTTTTFAAFTPFAQPCLTTDRLGRVTEDVYDAMGNLTKRIRAKGTAAEAAWTWTHNARGQVLEARDACYDPAKPDLHVTGHVYDAAGFLTGVVEAADLAGGTRPIRTLAYDSAGRLVRTADADGRRVDLTYDRRNRVVTLAYGGNVGITDDYEQFTYATSGQDVNLLTRHRDRNGSITDYAYDAAGRETRTTYAVGQADATGVKDCTYVAGSQLLASCVDLGERVTHAYDHLNRRVSTTRQARLGTVLTATITYDPARRIASLSDAYGRRQVFVYDRDDRVVRTVRDLVVGGIPASPAPAALPRVLTANPPYVVEDTTYDAEGQVTSRVDARGITDTWTYDGQGRLTRRVQAASAPAGIPALAYQTVVAYDRQGNRTAVTHPRTGQPGEGGSFQTVSTYSGRNLLLSETVAFGRPEAATRSWTYTRTGKPATAADGKGQVTSSTYYPCCDRLRTVVEPGGHTTTYAYDRHGNVTAVTDPNGNAVTTTYDGRHRVRTTTNAAGETTTTTYDDNGADATGLSGTYAAQLAGLGLAAGSDGSLVEVANPLHEKTVQVHDGLGRVVRTIDGNGNAITTAHDTVVAGLVETRTTDALTHLTSTRRDGLDRLRESYDALGRKTARGYDPAGNPVSIRDPNDVGVDCVFDAVDREVKRTDTVGAVTSHGYDAHGNRRTVTDALGHTTTCVFDGRDRTTACTDRLGGITAFTYDANDNLLSITDAEGKVTSYTYDARDLLLTEVYPPGKATPVAGTNKRSYTYDPARRLVSRTDQAGVATTYAYDDADRLLTRSYPDALDDTFAYDDAGRLTQAVSARFATTVTRSYTLGGEQAGRLRAETQRVGGSTFTVGYAYDADDRVTTITYPNGKQQARSYTARHELAGVSYDGASIATRSYDNGGRLTTTTVGNGLVESRTYHADNTLATLAVPGVTAFSYTYDAAKRKTVEGHQFPADRQTFAYDAEDRVTAWTRDGQESQAWTLTTVGDWQATTRTGVGQTRTHSAVHETLSLTTGAVTTLLDHDRTGNLTRDQLGQRYGWDHENRLAEGRAGAASSGYRYDALGRRLGRTALGITTAFVHDGAQVIAEYEAPLLHSTVLGAPALSGSFSDDGQGTVTLAAGGTDLWHGVDQGRYASATLTGDGAVVVRITSQTNTHVWAKAGVMLRESLAANARTAALLLTPGNGVVFQRRSATGGDTVATTQAGIGGPLWLRLTRTGATITAERSADGLAWTLVGSDAGVGLPTGTPIHVGLVVTSHTVAAVSTATFTNVAISGNMMATTAPAFARGYAYGSYVDEPLVLLPASGLVADRRFYHANHLHSVAALTGSTGAVVERYRYDAYGQRVVLAADGVTVRAASAYRNQVGFTGRYLDQESGLYHFRARSYSASLGRFLSRDPWQGRSGHPQAGDGYRDGVNAYAAYFVPNATDPSGLMSCKDNVPQGCRLIKQLGTMLAGTDFVLECVFCCDSRYTLVRFSWPR
jgi:RHS repeat-associated protein